ncbi:MAG: ABC transporter permease [Geminicoccaceae bacterium]|nr:ABC transporter permease [Geminicoccaceae bacterium]MCS7267304.1 ABC transporter permease [Geminicoccaceae bacterium]MCX7628620.1 ABC transporter permease [Geminicoccaceae bacterium]MDW8124833.1 ABC transporter permease [Geminicoccaceae bacterium]MDW8340643.1 ABC transporter permease [Geminicoccaceae bacterium]
MQSTRPIQTSVAIEDVTRLEERGPLARIVASQPFWVTVAVGLICVATAWYEPDTFPTRDNFFNITRNFAPIGIMAMGMIAVILTRGIDLSVGSMMALVGIATARLLEAGMPWWVGVSAGLGIGLLAGAVNGALVAYVNLPPFVVTLGTLSIYRSLAVVLSENRIIYDFGPGGDVFKEIGGGQVGFPWFDGGTFYLSHQFLVLVVLTCVFGFVFRWVPWGRYLYAIGGNEQAARLTGIPVDRIKLQAYMVCGLTTAIAALMLTGYNGSASNGMGRTWELYVIAAAVIGGTNLMGGEGGAYGGFIGAALIFLIRNSLIMFGVEANWYDLFVGLFIIFAVLLERIRGRTRG